MKVTILTPTYNRINTLENLYNSLLKQTSKNFEWLIVDDGSNDDTEKKVNEWYKQGKIKINYIKKKNGGKHTAVNIGVKKSQGELIFIVDSDDIITPNAVELINSYDKKYKGDRKICGFSFLRGYSNGNINGKSYKQYEFKSDYNKCRIKEKINGDKAEVYYKEILKQYPFPEFENEKFISEDVVWIKMAKDYKTIYINEIIYIGEYLEGGLTSSDKKVKFNSPIGSTLRGLIFLRSNIGLKYKLKGAIIYNCYKKELKNKIPNEIKLETKIEKLLVWLTYPLGIIYNKKWKKEIK